MNRKAFRTIPTHAGRRGRGRQALTAAECLWALRDECLRALIAYAKKNSPWHAERLRDIDPGRLDGESLGEPPTMDVTLLPPAESEPIADALASYPAIVDYSARKTATPNGLTGWCQLSTPNRLLDREGPVANLALVDHAAVALTCVSKWTAARGAPT